MHYEGTKQKEQIGIDYTVELGVEYKFVITSVDGQTKEEIIKIDDYWYDVAKTLDEGASIDNQATRAAYNKPYEATVTANDGYIIDTITVKVGGQEIKTSGDNIVDNTTGQIKIVNVTDNIEIIVTARKLEIVTTTPIINTSTSATSSLGANTQTKGTTLYINFKAAPDLVQYDAGDWIYSEIQALKNSKLYYLNASHTASTTFKLNDDSGYNFTFGGFTYKGDTENESNISSGAVITSRNKSVSPESRHGTPKYDGWQILTTERKTDESGNTIKNADGTERTYVTKLVHAGTPENFVYYHTTDYDSYRAEYLLSNGQKQTGYSKLSNGTAINPRSWDMYKDKDLDAKGYIKEVHAMTYSEAVAITGNKNTTKGIRNTGSYYWLATPYPDAKFTCLSLVSTNGEIGGAGKYCYGVRPVVTMESGVYIESGDGTEASPYILAKEE